MPTATPRASSSRPRAATPAKALTCGHRAADPNTSCSASPSRRRLALERLDLYYLHRIDPKVPFDEQIGVLAEARAAGSIRHIGLCRVTVEQIRQAQRITTIAAVQNKYNHQGGNREVIDYCAANGIAFVPFAPFAAGQLFDDVQEEHQGPVAQQALLRLLLLDPCVLPIPGTANLAHLQQNCRAPEKVHHTG